MLGRLLNKLYNLVNKRIYRIKLKNIGKGSTVSYCKLEGNNALGRNSHLINCLVGKNTYFGNNVILTESKIGRFCSIGDNVKIIAAQHPIDTFISTSPLFYTQNTLLKTYIKREKYPNFKYVLNTNFKVIVHNDVWIGSNVLILGGVIIGNGAIIAAGSVVIKDVEPYSIVGGVPAKHIKYRFDSHTILTLETYKWWDKSEEWFTMNAEYFSDVPFMVKQMNNEIKIKDKNVEK